MARSYRPTPPTPMPCCYHAKVAAYPDLGPGPIYEGCLVSVVLPLPRWFIGRKKPQQQTASAAVERGAWKEKPTIGMALGTPQLCPVIAHCFGDARPTTIPSVR